MLIENKTQKDLLEEYEYIKNNARCFSAWQEMDNLVKELIKRVAPAIIPTTAPFHEFSFDSEGTPVPYHND